jgi:hypothetical protein
LRVISRSGSAETTPLSSAFQAASRPAVPNWREA